MLEDKWLSADDLNKGKSCSEKFLSQFCRPSVKREGKGGYRMTLYLMAGHTVTLLNKKDVPGSRAEEEEEFSLGLVQFVGPLGDSYGEVPWAV